MDASQRKVLAKTLRSDLETIQEVRNVLAAPPLVPCPDENELASRLASTELPWP